MIRSRPAGCPLKEEEYSLLSECFDGLPLGIGKRWGMNMPRNAWFYSAIMPLGVLMNPVGALAAPDPAPAAGVDEVQEIIVTAQRRQERLQDVPIVLNAFDG